MLRISRTMVAVTLAAVVGSFAGADEPPTNRELVAAMPDTMESVLVLNAELLLREGCTLKRNLQGFFGVADDSTPETNQLDRDFVCSTGESNLDRVVFSEIVARKPIRRLVAGSGFQPPRGIGLGSFRFVTVWVTRETNEPVRRKIENRDGLRGAVTKTMDSGLEIYRSRAEFESSATKGTGKPNEEDIHVAFPTEHITIIGLSADDLRHIAKSFKHKTKDIPPRWQQAAAGINIESPVLILRKFVEEKQRFRKFDSEPAQEIKIMTVSIHSYAVTSGAGPDVKFQLRVITPEPENAEAYFYGGSLHGGFPPVYWNWSKQTDQGGFTAEVAFGDREGRNAHSELILLSMFGILMAI